MVIGDNNKLNDILSLRVDLQFVNTGDVNAGFRK